MMETQLESRLDRHKIKLLHIRINAYFLAFFFSYMMFMNIVQDSDTAPLLLIFRNLILDSIPVWSLVVAIPWFLFRYARKFQPWILTLIAYSLIYKLIWKSRPNMDFDCRRLQTDTFDNYFDGYTKIAKHLIPQYLPQTFKRGE
jgi:hypothetical protein